MDEEDLLKKYNALYLEVIMRYKDAIEQGEQLHVAELPKLITPEDEKVVSLANSIRGTFTAYTVDENFGEAAKKAYEYVKGSIKTVSPPIQFWLKPNEVINLGAGDIFDKTVLLCSVLISLGGVSAKIVTAIKDGNKKHKVYCDFRGKILAIDLDEGIRTFESKEKLLKAMGIEEDSEIDAYEFNDKMYSDLP